MLAGGARRTNGSVGAVFEPQERARQGLETGRPAEDGSRTGPQGGPHRVAPGKESRSTIPRPGRLAASMPSQARSVPAGAAVSHTTTSARSSSRGRPRVRPTTGKPAAATRSAVPSSDVRQPPATATEGTWWRGPGSSAATSSSMCRVPPTLSSSLRRSEAVMS